MSFGHKMIRVSRNSQFFIQHLTVSSFAFLVSPGCFNVVDSCIHCMLHNFCTLFKCIFRNIVPGFGPAVFKSHSTQGNHAQVFLCFAETAVFHRWFIVQYSEIVHFKIKTTEFDCKSCSVKHQNRAVVRAARFKFLVGKDT